MTDRATDLAPPRRTQWASVVALAVLIVATAFEWYWVWGVLFVYWAAVAITSGETYLVQSVFRRDNPVLFWLLVAMWAAFGLWYVIGDVVARL